MTQSHRLLDSKEACKAARMLVAEARTVRWIVTHEDGHLDDKFLDSSMMQPTAPSERPPGSIELTAGGRCHCGIGLPSIRHS